VDDDKKNDNILGAIRSFTLATTAAALERTQIAKYHTKGGHGFTAEDANTRIDRMFGRDARVIGTTNEANGADRLVNGIELQTKYCQTPSATVEEAFDPQSGAYRYGSALLEVPADQYESCIEHMRQKIAEGKVPGVTSPDEATNLVRKGHITYEQARNIARAGNIDSLKYDAQSQSITALSAFSISFLVSYSRARLNGLSNKEAMRMAFSGGVSIGTTSFFAGVLTAQVLRTRTAAVGAVTSRRFVRWFVSSKFGRTAVEHLAHGSLGRVVHGGAATNHVAKLLRTNAITVAATTVVTSLPDLYRAAVARNISWSQFSKNLLLTASSATSGTLGWLGGAALGTAVAGPVGGTVGAVVGSLGIGTAGGMGSRWLLDKLIDDDAKRMLEIAQDVVADLAFDYLLSEQELAVLDKKLHSVLTASWLKDMFKAGHGSDSLESRREFARFKLEPLFAEIAQKRPRLIAPQREPLDEQINRAVLGWLMPSLPGFEVHLQGVPSYAAGEHCAEADLS
jgi:hypothetical protein